VFLAGLWPILAGREALPQFVAAAEQNTLRVVAFDTLPVELEWLQAGVIDALIGQKYWGWGYDSMYMMFNHVTNAEYYPFIMDSGFDVVTQANVAVMMDFWQQRDFAQPLEPDSR
jgi:ribose transport system substrate-binding protein